MLSAEHPSGTLTLVPWNDSASESSAFATGAGDGYISNFNAHTWDTPGGPLDFVLKVWDRLKKQNAICTLPTDPDIFTFSESCLFFATITFTKTPPPKSGKQKIRKVSDRYSEDSDDDPWRLPRVVNPFNENELLGSKERGEAEKSKWDMMDHSAPTAVGCIYLSLTKRPQEASIGIVLLPEYTNRGVGPLALNLALGVAFDAYRFHRVCAVMADHPENQQAINVFKKLGFIHEGTHRLAAFGDAGEWRDELHFAMIDTEWVFRYVTPSPKKFASASQKSKQPSWQKSDWDQMLDRHSDEREALLERQGLRKTSSTETMRGFHVEEDDGLEYLESGSTGSLDEDSFQDPSSSSSKPVLDKQEIKAEEEVAPKIEDLSPKVSGSVLPGPSSGWEVVDSDDDLSSISSRSVSLGVRSISSSDVGEWDDDEVMGHVFGFD